MALSDLCATGSSSSVNAIDSAAGTGGNTVQRAGALGRVLGMQCFYTLEDVWESYAWGDRSHSGMSLQLGSLQTL